MSDDEVTPGTGHQEGPVAAGVPSKDGLRGYLVLSLVWLAVVGAILFFARRPSAPPIEIVPPPTVTSVPAPQATSSPQPIRVDVAGAVQTPGVYRLAADTIVADAIAAAGGAAPDADLDRLNKAAALLDGTQVYVPRIAEEDPPGVLCPLAPPLSPAQTATGIQEHLVDLNKAGRAELESLPGIGPELAQRIIDNRPYATREDIMRVPGIKEALYEKLRAYIVVE